MTSKTLLPDIEIARKAKLRPIGEIASSLGLAAGDIEHHGPHIAKVRYEAVERAQKNSKQGNLILVSAMTPTPLGEGKTTTSVGLAQAFAKMNLKTAVCIREASMGPVFGVKGGAAGGGLSQVVPMENINLHFTGDIHAVTSATNLLAAMIDNHIYHGNALDIDHRRALWRRALDMNDRALRGVVIGLGGSANGVPREDAFDITAASETMAILCLASGPKDLKERLSRTVVARTRKTGEPVTAAQLKAHGALTVLLKDALKPNLVQTLEGVPAFVHGGPFANIAHGCSSLISTRLALGSADWVVTEAGFGADLGAEKFFHIKCRAGGLAPRAVVIVATLRALRHHGGTKKENLLKPDLESVKRGMANLDKHVENVALFGIPAVVALNRFPGDSDEEVSWVISTLEKRGVPAALSEVWEKGGEGGLALAERVVAAAKTPSTLKFLYELEDSIPDKIGKIAARVYGASEVKFSHEADRSIERYTSFGLHKMPVCMAKTQYSFSEDPKLLGRPSGFPIHVSRIRASAGAGFLVCMTGDIMTMPGLPKVPSAEAIDLDEAGNVVGLF